MPPRGISARLSVTVLLGIVATALALVGSPIANAAAVHPALTHYASSSTDESSILEASEMMPAFLNGSVVNSEYEQGFFVGNFSGYSPATFGGEPIVGGASVGVKPNVFPTDRSHFDALWVLVPWWGPAAQPFAPAYDPAAFGIQLQCAPANIAVCFDHPATVSVPGLGVVPLPGHDHLINTAAGNYDEWWNVVVDLVLTPSVFPTLSGSTGITSLHDLRAAQDHGLVAPDIPTNFFLDFAVIAPGHADGKKSVAPEKIILSQSQMMPTFFRGDVYNSYYDQGYFVGNLSAPNATFGGEPLLGAPETGTAATGMIAGVMAGFYIEVEVGQSQAFYAAETQYFHSTGTSTVTIGSNQVKVTNYAANSANELVNECGSSFTYTSFALSIGTPSGTSFPLVTNLQVSGSETVNGAVQNLNYSIKLTAFTVA